MKITEMSRTRLRRLLRSLEGRKRILILTHDHPDPDGVASAMALQRLLARRLKGTEIDVGFGGIVGRAENRAMVKAVRAAIAPLDELDLTSYDAFALVDTQPRTGNNSLPPGKRPTVVLDHHPIRRETKRVPFHDVRTRFGATATMMYEYLKAARFRLDADLATALFYGIRAETQALTREASRADRDAYVSLLPQVDFRRIFEIEYAGVPREYFGHLGSAMANTVLYGDVAFSSLGEIPSPDFCAEFCDMILRLETTRWALCVGRSAEGTLYLSLRTRERKGHAGRTIARVVGREGKAGGHGMMAGGIALIEKFENPTYEGALEILSRRFLEETGALDREPVRLISPAGASDPESSEGDPVPAKAAVSS
jgi:nanoRNase/pAp phosphatase (c-di-AMP/oligoRNAs hydrolase)